MKTLNLCNLNNENCLLIPFSKISSVFFVGSDVVVELGELGTVNIVSLYNERDAKKKSIEILEYFELVVYSGDNCTYFSSEIPTKVREFLFPEG